MAQDDDGDTNTSHENKKVKAVMAMFRLSSDIHSEFYDSDKKSFITLMDRLFPALDTDPSTILLLAGDIVCWGERENFELFFRTLGKYVVPRFKKVLAICGNHEYYGNNILFWEPSFKYVYNVYWSAGVQLLNEVQGFYEDEEVVVVGDTLWTDGAKEPLVELEMKNIMNDYRLIKCGQSNLTPYDTLKFHKSELEYIQETLDYAKGRKKKGIVVSHHAPSSLSIADGYKGSVNQLLNRAYYTDLSGFIMKYKPALWVHGHTHDSFDYNIHKTRVVCNPSGYLLENEFYEKVKVIEV